MNVSRILFLCWLPCTLMLLFCSCKEDDPKKEITRIVSEWQGKQVIFPEEMVFTRYGQDTIPYNMEGADHKVLLYVDSVGCTSCKLQLHKWSEFIAELDSLTYGSVPVLFFFHAKDKRELAYLLKRDVIDIPVCIDDNDRLNALNQFPTRSDFQCFLLDKENKVVCIGNPVYNPNIKEMYFSRIASENYVPASPSKNTTVEMDQTEFDLGTLKKGEPATITAQLRNVGDSPFIIYDTQASCGCTSVLYKKEPVPPGASMEIAITYNAEDGGHFNKTIFVYGNMDVSPLVIRLKGNTIKL